MFPTAYRVSCIIVLKIVNQNDLCVAIVQINFVVCINYYADAKENEQATWMAVAFPQEDYVGLGNRKYFMFLLCSIKKETLINPNAYFNYKSSNFSMKRYNWIQLCQ